MSNEKTPNVTFIDRSEIYRNRYHIPKLYKYFSDIRYLKDLLENERIYLISPSHCNDPYESGTVFPYSELERQELANTTGRPISIKPILQSKNTLLYCFSEDPKSIIMWSHYANNHKGFCVEFDFYTSDLKDKIHRVIYSDILDTDNYYHSRILKSTVWSYEKEWRMMGTFNSPSANQDIEDEKRYLNVKGIIKKIIIGYNSSEMDIQEINEISNRKGYEIKYANIDDSEFKIIFNSIRDHNYYPNE